MELLNLRYTLMISVVLAMGIINSSCIGTLIVKNIDANSEDWFTPGGSFERTSHIKSNELIPPLNLAWKKQFNSGVAGQPVIIDGILVVPFLNGELVALRLSDGKKIDRKKFGKSPIEGFTIFGETAYWALRHEKKSYRAFDLINGRYIWKARLGIIESSPAIKEDLLYIGNSDRLFYCLDKKNGKIIWKHRESDRIHVAPVLSSHQVYYCDNEGGIYSRRMTDGKLVWSTFLSPHTPGQPVKPYSYPVISNGQLFITTLDGSVFALDTQDGRTQWSVRIGDPIFASVSIDSFNVYVPASSGKIYSMKKDSGEVNWTYDGETIINTEILISDSLLVASTCRGDIIFLEKSTGNPIWIYTLKHRIVTPPIFAEGYLIISDDNKWIYAFVSAAKETEEQR